MAKQQRIYKTKHGGGGDKPSLSRSWGQLQRSDKPDPPVKTSNASIKPGYFERISDRDRDIDEILRENGAL